jgi:UDP-N-acetylmuramate: L-alanyl-gamma-D-glutamyl-meso-diaminopimelate ligase
MSDQLRDLGIDLIEGYGIEQLAIGPDLYVVGNVVSRGNPLMEAILDAGLAYTSGPQWLAEQVLAGRHVLAVAGTHGKTSTSSMLAWVLDQAGLQPGFLIGGVPQNFGISARLGALGGRSPGERAPFVIEADEYDTAFFDKRSKFVHYRPRTAILNNLEYDHADIWRPSRPSSTIWCAPSRRMAAWSSTAARTRCSGSWRADAGARSSASAPARKSRACCAPAANPRASTCCAAQ